METKKEKWQIELEAGNSWRAKEILRSNIRWNYDTKIYLVYGKILYDVKDYYEAGKYLFIAGEALDGEYKDAINIFLERHNRTDTYNFISNFPRRFVQEDFDNYPKSVQNYLQNRGYDKKDFVKFKRDNQYVQTKSPIWIKGLGIISLIFVMASLVVGGVTIIEYFLGKL